MALTATFAADFSKWDAALANAKVNLKSFEVSAKGAQAQLANFAKGFSGDRIIREAKAATAAIEKIGGVSKLTGNETKRVSGIVTEALAKYKALGQEAPAHIQRVNKELQAQVGRLREQDTAAKASTISFKSLVASYFTAEAALSILKTGFRAVVELLKSSIESYAAAEAAQKKLTTALTAQGVAAPTVIESYRKLATEFQRTTVFSDDLVTEMQALLVQVGDVMPSQMKGALKASSDLAAGLGIDLRQATLLVGKAFAGETGTLKRYGIVVDEAKLKTEGATAVLEAINAQFGGQAQAQLDTYAGKVQQLANNWDNLKEAAGGAIVTSESLALAMREINRRIADVGDKADETKPSIADWWETLTGSGSQAFVIRVLENYAKAANDLIDTLDRLAENSPYKRFVDSTSSHLDDYQRINREAMGVFDDWVTQTEKAKKAAEAHAKAVKKSAEEQRVALLALGIVTEKELNVALEKLAGLQKRAVSEGVPLEQIVTALYPKFAELAKQALASGTSLDAVAAAMARARAVFAPAATEMAKWEAENVSVDASLGGLIGTLESYSVAAEVAGVESEILAEAMKRAGVTSREELSKTARQAERDWRLIVQTYGEKSREATAAYKVMIEAQRAESGKLPSVWEKEIFPRIKDVIVHLTDAINGSFAQMLLGAKGFKDGFVDIWNSIKAAIINILNSILSYFINSFLKGLIASLMGQKGAFQTAFSGLFSGGTGGGSAGGGITDSLVQAGRQKLLGWLFGGGTSLAGPVGTVTAGIPSVAGIGTTVPIGTGGVPGLTAGGAAGTPWWSTTAGGAALGAGAGIAVGEIVGGRTGNKVGGAAAGAASGATVGLMLGGPIGALFGGAIGGAWGWYAAKRANKKANDLRDEYFMALGQNAFGGFTPGAGAGSTFQDVAGALTESTGEAGGGKLFQDLIKANDPGELAEAIAAVNQELGEYFTKKQEAAKAEADHAAKIEETKAQFQEQADLIRAEMKTLDDELAAIDRSEAPEEHMGTIEKRARARIARQKAQLEADLRENNKRMEEAIAAITQAGVSGFDALARSAQTAFDQIANGAEDASRKAADALNEIDLSNPYLQRGNDWLRPGTSLYAPIPMADGGSGRVTKPTLFLAGEAGPEDVAFSGANKRFSNRSGMDTDAILDRLAAIERAILTGRITSVQIDGREIVRATVNTVSGKGFAKTRMREALGVG
jgi:hypothetical protein